jgi:hypothetical protein
MQSYYLNYDFWCIPLSTHPFSFFSFVSYSPNFLLEVFHKYVLSVWKGYGESEGCIAKDTLKENKNTEKEIKKNESGRGKYLKREENVKDRDRE